MTVSYSQRIMDIASSTHSWPQTTKPWIVANALVHDSENASIQTFCGESAQEFVSSLSFGSTAMLDISCFSVADGRWVRRRVVEVLLGTLGEAAVAVFRDDQGIDFSPDAPLLPVSQVTGLAFVCAVQGHHPVRRSPQAEAYGKRIYQSVLNDIQERGEAKVVDPAATTQTT